MDQLENNLRKALREPEPSGDLAGKVMSRLAAPKKERSFLLRWREALLIAVPLVVGLVFVSVTLVRNARIAPLAVLESADGELDRLSGGMPAALKVGGRIVAGQILRSEGGAVLALADGSRVEMRSKSELSLQAAEDGRLIRLNAGSIIVTAAKQRNGHLYVRTKDVNVSVVGTVFLVNAEQTGSRVAVIQGEVQVQQGQGEKKLRPGEQVATNPLMESHLISEEISWSRNAEAHLALLQQSVGPAPILSGSIQNSPTGTAGTTPSVRLAFDVASIKPHAPGLARTLVGPAPSPEGAGGGDGTNSGGPAVTIFPGGRLLAAKATLFEIIRYAYHSSQMDWRLESRRISGGPDWIRSSEYNIEAKAEGASRDQMQLMLQSLLADRFKLRLHWETRELPVYELTAAKGGLKLEQWKEGSCVSTSVPAQELAEIPAPPLRPAGAAGAGASPAQRWNPKYSCGVYFRGFGSVQNVYAGKATIGELIRVLEFRVGRTIIDKTGFTPTFNAILAFNPNDGPNPDPSAEQGVVPLPTAMQEQLGLKLESAKGPVSVLVIDSAEKPSEN